MWEWVLAKWREMIGRGIPMRILGQKRKETKWPSDNAVVNAFKLILLNYNNFSIVKKVVNKIERVK